MKALLVFAHPRKESFTHALVHRVTEALVANGAEVTVRDLYKLDFDSVLRGEDTIHIENGKFVREATSFPPDVQTEMDLIAESDLLVIFFQVGGMVCLR